jgi:hypothetical protein
MAMATNVQNTRLVAVALLLKLFVGISFAWISYTKLSGTHNTIQYFSAIGWGQWFRYATGAVDLAGVVLLFVPRWTWLGCAFLFCSVGTATLISVTLLRGNPIWGGSEMLVIPLVMTGLCALLGWLTRPESVR